MKNISIILFLMCITLGVYSVPMDTVQVSTTLAARIKLDDGYKISDVIFGGNPVDHVEKIGNEEIIVYRYYNLTYKDNILIVNTTDKNSPFMTLDIILENEYKENKFYNGFIEYAENPKKTTYEFPRPEKENILSPKMAEEKRKNAEMRNKLHICMERKDKYFKLESFENNIYMRVGYIINDNDYTYMKITFSNQSASEYIIDGILFKHLEPKKKKAKKSEAKNETDIIVKYEDLPKNNIIGPYTTEKLGYVLPLFTTGFKGKLQIKILELNGSRNMEMKIKAKDLSNIEVFK